MDLIRSLIRSVNPDYIEPCELFKDRVLLCGDVECYLHLRKGRVYLLRGEVNILPGSRLKIDAGVVVEVEDGAILRVQAGATITAEGKEDCPIIFTSCNANALAGSWLGIRIEGYTASSTVDGPIQIADSTCDLNSSGILRFVRVEYAGIEFISVSEATCVENVQVSLANDSFLFSGGTVNARRLISYKPQSVGFRLALGYQGHLQEIFNIHGINANPNAIGILIQQQIFEPSAADIPEITGDGFTPLTRATVSQATLIGPLESDDSCLSSLTFTDMPQSFGVVIQSGLLGGVNNSIISGYLVGVLVGPSIIGSIVEIQNVRLLANAIGGLEPAIFIDPAGFGLFRVEILRAFNSLVRTTRLFEFFCEPSYILSQPSTLSCTYSYNITELTDPYFKFLKYRGAFKVGDDWTRRWSKFNIISCAC